MDSKSISELTFTNVCQMMHTDAAEWRSHCSFPQVFFGKKNFLLQCSEKNEKQKQKQRKKILFSKF